MRPIAIGLAMLASSCAAPEAPPPVKPIGASVEMISVLPPPPPPPIVVSSPTDIGECLPQTFQYRELPVMVTLSAAGRALSLEFYSQCTGQEFTVPPEVAQCIQAKLKSWEWQSSDRSEAATTEAGWDNLVAVRPSKQGVKLGRTERTLPFTSFGCGGGN